MSIELAWAAGFFDGEGCTSYRVRKNRKSGGGMITMQVSQSGLSNKTPPVELARFRDALGFGYIANRNAARKEHYKFSWDWHINKWSEVELAFQLLNPYWSETKREQWLIAAQKFRDCPSFGRGIGQPRKEFCIRGHDYSKVYVYKTGARKCLECDALLRYETNRRRREMYALKQKEKQIA